METNKTLDTKRAVALEIFGVEYRTLWGWAQYGPPKGKLVFIDDTLLAFEKSNELAPQGKPHERVMELKKPENFRLRLSNAFPLLWFTGGTVKQIGIDPGKDTGFAVVENGEIVTLETLTFWEAYYRTRELIDTSTVSVVVVEVPHTKKNWHGPNAAHDVGRVCREAELLADGIEQLGVEVIRQHPAGKANQEYFTRVTGWKKRTNQHCRDAAMLVFGR